MCSHSEFMGRSFRCGGWGQSLHRIGLDRPAIPAANDPQAPQPAEQGVQ
jgi:hypothetical protein